MMIPKGWGEASIADAVKDVTDNAKGREEDASTLKLTREDLALIDDAIIGPPRKKGFGTPDEPGKKYPSDDKKLLKQITDAVKKNLASAKEST